MYRLAGPHASLIYDAAELWVQRHLASDGSLFSDDPARPVATEANVAALYDAFVNHPDEGKDSFAVKLRGQLRGRPPDVVQLAAEALFVLLLPASPRTIGGTAKRQMINQTLAVAPGADPIPDRLNDALEGGLARMGMAFLNMIWRQYQFMLEFLHEWKISAQADRDRRLAEPTAFRTFLFSLPVVSAFTERYAIAHLVFPDTFLPVVSQEHRARILQRFADRISDPTANEDDQLAQVTTALVVEYGADADFYAPPVINQWQERSAKWRAFTAWTHKVAETVDVNGEENEYKRVLAALVADARNALLDDRETWRAALKKAMTTRDNNLVSWQAYDKFLAWAQATPEDAAEALKVLWVGDEPAPIRVQRFTEAVPPSAPSGLGARLSIAAYLLMGVDAKSSPPYRSEALAKAYKLTGYGKPELDSAFSHYQHALRFFDFLIAEAARDGWTIPSRLEAQSLAWIVVHGPREQWSTAERDAFAAWLGGDDTSLPGAIPTLSDPPNTAPGTGSLADLAHNLYLPESFLAEIVRLLSDRKQVVFYGPPGTGKTFVARALADHLAGDSSRVTFVQFHAAYAYEDFVEGLRPRPDGTFHLAEGPLRRIAREAATSDHTHVLVIDEINRANVARVLGELYFLLEYREQPATLLYSGDQFSLPDNLLLIGTMNSADRSISLIDTALRRRFYFVGFFPDRQPIADLLQTYLIREHPNMTWLAEVLALVNKQLEGSGTSIGPSHFIRSALDDRWLQTIWNHAIMPALEDHFYGQESKLQDFTLDRLRTVSGVANDDQQPTEPTDGSSDPD